MFRVAAENEVGVGAFVELGKAVIPKSQHGKCIVLCIFTEREVGAENMYKS